MQLPFTYFHLDKNNEMIQKLSDALKIHTATSLCYFEKDSILESLIYHLKYGGQQKLGEYFGELIIDLIKSNELFKNIEAVIPVPLNSKRKRKRGYNQVTVFGKKIAAYLGVPFVEGYLLRTQNTKQLAKTSSKDRSVILKNAFQIKTKNTSPKHWLLVDDVITTGATLEACGSLLLENPENRLSIATIGYRI